MARPDRPRLPRAAAVFGQSGQSGQSGHADRTGPTGSAGLIGRDASTSRTVPHRLSGPGDGTPSEAGAAPNDPTAYATSPARRSLLRGGLAIGAAAAVGLTGGLWAGRGTAEAATVDYPSATWAPASTSNYTASNRPSSYAIDMVVIHVTQETFADTISLFQDPTHAAAAHYVVRSADGHIDQCVREHDIAWHAGNWTYNTRSIGIEHEGWVDQPSYFTTAMYHASAALTAEICDRYGIPKDRDHIIGHYQVPGTDHTDPGPYWDWVRYIRLVNGV